jgi:ABC-2 type transport system permease protein
MNPTLRGFLVKEFLQTLRDTRMRILLFVAPIVQLTLFGYAISTEIRHIRVGFVYQQNDRIAARVLARCAAGPWIQGRRLFTSDPAREIVSGHYDAVCIFPARGLSRSLMRGERNAIQLLADASNVLRVRGVEQYLQAMVGQEIAPRETAKKLPAFHFVQRILYNPGLKTAYFMVPGVMVMLMCILTIIMTSMALAREKEIGTFETLLAAPIANWEILLGKTLPYMLLGLAQSLLILLAALIIFQLPFRGAFWQYLLAAAVFVFTSVAIGTLISTISRNQQQAMMGSFMFMFPAILLSGLMFPVENMPAALSGVALLNPIKYFLVILRNLFLKGGNALVFWSNLGVLGLLGSIAAAWCVARFRQRLN